MEICRTFSGLVIVWVIRYFSGPFYRLFVKSWNYRNENEHLKCGYSTAAFYLLIYVLLKILLLMEIFISRNVIYVSFGQY